MTAGSPVRLVVLFSIPLIFGNIFQQLYYITDAVIVGKYISIQALAAVNSCTWITWLLNAIARDFSNTLSILASYSVGEGDQEKVKKIVGNAGTITLLLSLFLLVFAETNLDLFFRLFKVQAEVIQMTGEYFSIVLLGIPFVLIYNAAAALLRAEGNSQVTFHSVAVATVINIVLDVLFIVHFGWGVKGGAAATVIAQFVSMVIALVPLLKSKMFTKDLSYWKLDVSLLKQIVSLWLPMFVNSAVITIGGSYVSRNVNAIGPYFTAGISSGTKIFTMLESLIMAIQTGLSVFIGQNLGAGLRERVRKGQHQVVLFSLVLSFFLNIVVQSLAPVLVRNIFICFRSSLCADTSCSGGRCAGDYSGNVYHGTYVFIQDCHSDIGTFQNIQCMQDFYSFWQEYFLFLSCQCLLENTDIMWQRSWHGLLRFQL